MIGSLFTVFPTTAFASSTVIYIESSWNATYQQVDSTQKDCNDWIDLRDITSNELEDGKWYVLTQDTTVSERLYVNSGTVNLILCDDKTLTAERGIGVKSDATLNIYGQPSDSGKIVSHISIEDSALGYAAIGGDDSDENCGIINIHGGTFDLLTSKSEAKVAVAEGACIGGGNKGEPKEITIYGGEIQCESNLSACIGGGYGGNAGSTPDKGIRI